mmetsp:Transcript_23494/g.46746  ORF Transcript_23494/g.46746 Transcript_23494/m.46746 type:complete len:239 (+) Transcript_23494:87-803(+)
MHRQEIDLGVRSQNTKSKQLHLCDDTFAKSQYLLESPPFQLGERYCCRFFRSINSANVCTRKSPATPPTSPPTSPLIPSNPAIEFSPVREALSSSCCSSCCCCCSILSRLPPSLSTSPPPPFPFPLLPPPPLLTLLSATTDKLPSPAPRKMICRCPPAGTSSASTAWALSFCGRFEAPAPLLLFSHGRFLLPVTSSDSAPPPLASFSPPSYPRRGSLPSLLRIPLPPVSLSKRSLVEA